jgi:hypothetical protein
MPRLTDVCWVKVSPSSVALSDGNSPKVSIVARAT